MPPPARVRRHFLPRSARSALHSAQLVLCPLLPSPFSPFSPSRRHWRARESGLRRSFGRPVCAQGGQAADRRRVAETRSSSHSLEMERQCRQRCKVREDEIEGPTPLPHNLMSALCLSLNSERSDYTFEFNNMTINYGLWYMKHAAAIADSMAPQT